MKPLGKQDALIPILVGLLFVSSLATALLGARYFFSVRTLKRLQGQMEHVNRQRAFVNNLVNDTRLYSRQNPAVEAILVEFDLKTRELNASGKSAPKNQSP